MINETKDKLQLAEEALRKLACLGNGDSYGNPIGNTIAQEALAAIQQSKESSASERERFEAHIRDEYGIALFREVINGVETGSYIDDAQTISVNGAWIIWQAAINNQEKQEQLTVKAGPVTASLGYLCYAYGESSHPVARLTTNRAEVQAFIVEEWLGSIDDQMLPEAMSRFDLQDWDDDNEIHWEFEIGGVRIMRVIARLQPERNIKELLDKLPKKREPIEITLPHNLQLTNEGYRLGYNQCCVDHKTAIEAWGKE